MWTDEASGAYIAYSSIAEEGTSSRAHLKNLTHHQSKLWMGPEDLEASHEREIFLFF